MVQRRREAASESRLQIYRYLIYVSIYQIASSERHEDDGRTFRKEKKCIFRRIKKNELRRSERENRVGFPGRVNICVQEKIRGGGRAEKRRGKRVVKIKKFEKNDSRRKSKTKKRKNASSNSSPLHHEFYGAAASGGGVGNFNSDRLSSDIAYDISIGVGKFSRMQLRTFRSEKTMSLRENRRNRLTYY